MKSFYNKKMTIQEASTTGGKDEWGSNTITWSNVAGLVDCPCRFNWLLGLSRGERFVDGKVQWTRDANVYTKYYDNITTKMRLVYDSENYDIVNLANVSERDKFMILVLKKTE